MTWEDLDQHSKDAFEKRGRDPQVWVAFADDLHRAAGLLWDQVDRTESSEKIDWLVSVGKIAMMLDGYAIEMLAKAIHVRRKPDSVKDGDWLGPRKGHPLPQLLQGIGFTVESPEERDLVARLAGFASWAGRYPIPTNYRMMASKLTREGVELAPGTYLSTSDRHHIDRLIARLMSLTTEDQDHGGPGDVDS